MTDQEVEKMLSATRYRLGLDPHAVFYAQFLWWSKGEQQADEWIKRYKYGKYFGPQPPVPGARIWSSDYMDARKAREEMERFYRREIPVEFTRTEKNHWLNQTLFLADAQRALLTQMLEVAGFPARSVQFVELEREAIVMIGDRERETLLAYLQSKAMSEQMEKHLKGDGAEIVAKAESEIDSVLHQDHTHADLGKE